LEDNINFIFQFSHEGKESGLNTKF